MADTTTMTIGGQDYDVRVEGDELVVGPAGATDDQLVERVALDQLGDDARSALDRGDLDDGALSVALEGIVRAAADRGA